MSAGAGASGSMPAARNAAVLAQPGVAVDAAEPDGTVRERLIEVGARRERAVAAPVVLVPPSAGHPGACGQVLGKRDEPRDDVGLRGRPDQVRLQTAPRPVPIGARARRSGQGSPSGLGGRRAATRGSPRGRPRHSRRRRTARPRRRTPLRPASTRRRCRRSRSWRRTTSGPSRQREGARAGRGVGASRSGGGVAPISLRRRSLCVGIPRQARDDAVGERVTRPA